MRPGPTPGRMAGVRRPRERLERHRSAERRYARRRPRPITRSARRRRAYRSGPVATSPTSPRRTLAAPRPQGRGRLTTRELSVRPRLPGSVAPRTRRGGAAGRSSDLVRPRETDGRGTRSANRGGITQWRAARTLSSLVVQPRPGPATPTSLSPCYGRRPAGPGGSPSDSYDGGVAPVTRRHPCPRIGGDPQPSIKRGRQVDTPSTPPVAVG
jgi:hypothetical protein